MQRAWMSVTLICLLAGHGALASEEHLSPPPPDLRQAALRTAANPEAELTDRLAALRVLRRGADGQDDDLRCLAELLVPQTPLELQLAAVEALGRSPNARASEYLLSDWTRYGPRVHAAAVAVLLWREPWLGVLKEEAKRPELAASREWALRDIALRYPAAEIRAHAEKLLVVPITKPEVRKSLDKFLPALSVSGDAVRGKKVFVEATCANCHSVGPLKMEDTDFWVHPENAGRICQIYKQPRPGVLERGREAGKLTEKPTLFLGGQGLCSSTEDYERFCRMMLGRGELDGVRVLKPETVDLMFQNHVKPEVGRQYGLGGAVDGEGGYAWGGANGTQFWLDRKNGLFAIFMVQTQLYRAPTYNTFRRLANASAGIASGRAPRMLGEDSAVRGSPDPAPGMTAVVRGSPDPAPGMTDRSPASGRPAVGVSGEVGRPAPSAEDGAAADGGRGITSLFKQRDRNGDGRLSRNEIPAALFDRLDSNKDRFLTWPD